MKISIDRNSLLNTLSHVQNVVERRNTVPILSNILIDAKSNNIVLSATDMDLSITETIVCSVIEEGSITTAALTLFEIVRKTPEGSEIELISNDGSKLSVRSGKSKFSLSCLPKDDFPKIDNLSLESELYFCEKLKNKNCDMIIANDVSKKDSGFNSEYNKVSIIDKKGKIISIPKSKKSYVANAIAKIILDKLLMNDKNIN